MESVAELISIINGYLSTLRSNRHHDAPPQRVVALSAGDVLFAQGDLSDSV